MRSWRRDDDGFVARMQPDDQSLLETLVRQVREVLVVARDGRADLDEPVIARLFPAAYADDDDADEFRRLSTGDIATVRIEHLDAMLATLTAAVAGDTADDAAAGDAADVTVRLDAEAARHWATGLTDLRLVLATRVAQGPEALAPELDERDLAQFRAVTEWLGFVQGSLVELL